MRQLFIVVAKLLGFLQLYWSIALLGQIGVAVYMLTAQSSPLAHSTVKWGLAGFGAYFLLMLALAWILLAKTDRLADMLGITNEPGPSIISETILLSTGIRLIGLYVVVMAAPAIIKAFLDLQGTYHSMGISSWSSVIRSGLELSLGCILALKADSVIPYIAIAGKDKTKE